MNTALHSPGERQMAAIGETGMVSAVPHAAPPDGVTTQFITFSIGAEEYGVDVLAVREIKAWTAATTLPNAPDYVRGVVNLRGHIIPILDLRCRFGQGLTEPTATHVTIITRIAQRVVGILADAVSDIVSVDAAEIRPIPTIDSGLDTSFLAGLVAIDGRMVALLDLDRLFEARTIQKLNEGEPS